MLISRFCHPHDIIQMCFLDCVDTQNLLLFCRLPKSPVATVNSMKMPKLFNVDVMFVGYSQQEILESEMSLQLFCRYLCCLVLQLKIQFH